MLFLKIGKKMAIRFSVVEDNNKIIFLTDAEGNDVIRAPLLNKGTGFTKEERDSLKLNGLIMMLILESGMEKVQRSFPN